MRVVYFRPIITGKGASPTNQCWCQKNTVIAVSCVIKIFSVHHLVLSQCTRLIDGQTDGQTEKIATAIPCVALGHTCRTVKM